MNRSVFVSRPSAMNPSQCAIFRSWCSKLGERGLLLQSLPRCEYAPDPWGVLRERLEGVQGAVIFGFCHIRVLEGVVAQGTDEERPTSSAATSAWMHIEAGLALAAGLPVLALSETGITDGVFDPSTWGRQVVGRQLSNGLDESALDELLLAIEGHARIHGRPAQTPPHRPRTAMMVASRGA